MLDLSETYQIKKGDTLDAVAVKFGHRTGDTIWKDKNNKSLVSKRGQPEKLQPGDKLVIPPSPKMLKRVVETRASLEAEKVRLERQVKALDEVLTEDRAMTKQVIGELSRLKAQMKGFSDKIDMAATLIGATVSIGKLTKMGFQSTKLAGAELEKLNHEALKEVTSFVKEPLEGAFLKVGATWKENANKMLAFVGQTLDLTDKVLSPSYWANAWVQYRSNGKSWDKALASEVGEDIEDKIRDIEAAAEKRCKRIEQRKAEIEQHLRTVKAAVGELGSVRP